jgi:very-short-patch-repair endonuclease
VRIPITLRCHAREMRHAPTADEHRVWWWLRNRRFGDYKFRRQVPIGRYIVDFYCAELRLVIEWDGSQHNDVAMSEYDSERTLYLRAHGVEVVRIPNELARDEELGFECIRQAIAARIATG